MLPGKHRCHGFSIGTRIRFLLGSTTCEANPVVHTVGTGNAGMPLKGAIDGMPKSISAPRELQTVGWSDVPTMDAMLGAGNALRRVGRTEHGEKRPHRHLASPDEVIALLNKPAGHLSSARLHSRAWPDLRFVDASFPTSGAAIFPPPAFYAVGRVAGSSARVCQPSDRGQQAPQVVHEGALLINSVARGFHYAWKAPHQVTLMCLDPELMRNAAAESGIGDPGLPDIASSFDVHDPVCEHLVMVIAEEARLSEHAAQPMIVESVASALALRLLGRFSASGPMRLSVQGALTGRAFEQVRAYMEDNVGTRITLQDLARVAGVSRFHFARQFRLRTGESPMGYLLRSRIERAKPMLRRSESKVSDIAANLGFADQSHFTRTFRRMVGMSPSEFARLGKFRRDETSVDDAKSRPQGPDHKPSLMTRSRAFAGSPGSGSATAWR